MYITLYCINVLVHMFEQALMKHETDAMKESRTPDFLTSVRKTSSSYLHVF